MPDHGIDTRLIGTDRLYFPVEQTLEVKNIGASTVYYGDSTVTTSSYTGSIAAGASAMFTTGTWLIAATQTQVRLDYVVATEETVEDYGAVGDGVTNDTSAIQAAINATSAAGGGTVALPSGTFLVTGLTLKSLVTLAGSGMYSTTIKLANSTNNSAVVVKGDSFASLTGGDGNGGVYGAGIRDLTIDGNKANNASAGNGISIFGYDNRFANLRVTNCKGTGLFHEWGDTSAVSSDTLATGSMECHSHNLKIDRNEGGGIDWYGPSDSVFVDGIIAKNGPASNTTTVGVIVRGYAYTCQFTNYHVWGTLHKYGWRLDVNAILAGCSAEGADTGNVWFRYGGQQLHGFKFYNPGANVDYGLIIGDSGNSLFSGDNVVDGKFKDCGIQFQKDSGGGHYKCSFYWADNTKTFITNTQPQNTTRPNKWDILQQPVDGPPAAIGTLNSIARETASINDARRLSGQRWAINNGIVQNIPRWACDKDQTGMVSGTGKVFVQGGLSIAAGQTITSVSFLVGATAYAASAGGHLWAAMWDASTLALLAQSTDDTTGTGAMPASARKTFTFSSAYTSASDRDVYVGVCAAGSSGFVSPSFWGSFLGAAYIAQEAPAVSIFPATSGLTTTAPNPLDIGGATYSTKVIYCSLA